MKTLVTEKCTLLDVSIVYPYTFNQWSCNSHEYRENLDVRDLSHKDSLKNFGYMRKFILLFNLKNFGFLCFLQSFIGNVAASNPFTTAKVKTIY